MSLWETLLAWPVLPATVLLAMLMAWSLLAVMGGVVFHGTHLHFDADADGDLGDAFSSVGSFTLRWLNLSEMPFMIWLGAFALIWWSLSLLFWNLIDTRLFGSPGSILSLVLIIRNIVGAALLTKLVTRPFCGWYVSEDDLTSRSLIGQECEICSSEATTEYGQVRYKTDGSPLLLNVRTDGPELPKGTRVWITHYDAVRRAYIVSPTSQGT